MSRSKRPRKAYRPRHIAVNTLDLALHRAAKPALEDREDVLAKLDQAIAALCQGRGTETDWSVAAGAVAVATAIERQGVVRGLQEHLDHIEDALQAIYDRCRRTSLWLRPTLTLHELDALRLLHELHSFQVHQLSRAEFLAAIEAAQRDGQKDGQKDGHTFTVVRDLERMAA